MNIKQFANPYGHKKTAESRIARLTAEKKSAEERIAELTRENRDLRAKLEATFLTCAPRVLTVEHREPLGQHSYPKMSHFVLLRLQRRHAHVRSDQFRRNLFCSQSDNFLF